jgi:molybdopterin synthase sulfur carrier subunit
MSVTVRFPSPLRGLTGGKGEDSFEADSVRALIDAIEERYAGTRQRLCEESGSIRRFVRVYVNDEDIRTLSGLQTPLADGDAVVMVPAVAGG